MLSTSVDILNLILALCITVLTFFLCWALFYVIVSVRRFYRITRKVDKIVTEGENIVEMIKEKMQSSAAYLFTAGEMAKKIFDFIKEKKRAKDYEEEEEEEAEEPKKASKKKSLKKKIKKTKIVI
jgi:cell shape-determining protein MreC